jgi:alpha-mannosidase
MARKVLHLISQAHLDPVWLWPWRDGAAEALTTIQSAVDRAREIRSFRFTRSSAEIYRWVKETDPRLFAEIRRLIRAGRWEVVGGWIEQPDCNLPSGESFIRQSLLGQTWLRENLGVTATIGYNVDSFGHAGGMPQLLKKAGLTHYVFMRPQAHEAPNVPNLFWWEGDDGSRVLTQRVPGEYSQTPRMTADELEALIRSTHERHFSPGFHDGIFWLGIGNHGGGPTREHLARILTLQRDTTLPELRFSSVADYFAAIESSRAIRSVPTIRGELQFHARGCYVATSEVKQLHRRAELALYTAEALSTCAELSVSKHSQFALNEAWWRLLFSEFHDILAGTCVAATWAETRDRFGSTLHAAEQAGTSATHELARKVDTRGEPGSVLFMANPLPWARKALVQLDTFSDPHGRDSITHLETKDGRIVPLQWMRAEANFGPHLMPWGKLTAAVDLPACGYTVLRLATGGKSSRTRKIKSRVELDTAGGIRSWKSSLGQELLAAPIRLGVFADASDTWAHGVKKFGAQVTYPRLRKCHVAEDGPVCKVHRQQFSIGRSQLWLDLIEHSWTEAIELRIRFDWRERRKILALEIPTRLRRAQFFAKGPGFVAVRPANAEEQPGHEWTAVSGQLGRKAHTVGLVNAESYSHSCADGTLRVLLVRSTPFAEHDPMKVAPNEPLPWIDHGWHERRFWLIEGAGNWRTLGIEKLSADLRTPVTSMLDSAHAGTEPWSQSMLSLSGDHVAVLAIKATHAGDGWVVRAQEMSGQSRRARLSIPRLGVTQTIRFEPWEIKTVCFSRTGAIAETNLLENKSKP